MGIVRRNLAWVKQSNGNIHPADSACNGHSKVALGLTYQLAH
jgi:hypothetical protein